MWGMSILVVAGVAIIVFLWLVLPVLSQAPTPVGNRGPLAVTVGLSTPTEQATSANHWYNFSVEYAVSGIEWGDLRLGVTTQAGTTIGQGQGWTAEALGSSGNVLTTYDLTFDGGGNWTGASSAPILSGQVLALDSSSSSLAGQGDTLNILYTHGSQGSISVSIP
jgi:hypothetical protein